MARRPPCEPPALVPAAATTLALVADEIAATLDPAAFSGHSLRAGFLTSAAEAGADVLKMAEVSRHRSMDTLRRYVRRGNLFKGHAGAAFL